MLDFNMIYPPVHVYIDIDVENPAFKYQLVDNYSIEAMAFPEGGSHNYKPSIFRKPPNL